MYVRSFLLKLLFISFIIYPMVGFSQKDIKLGVFYFDGWTGKTNHASHNLKTNFIEREPIWGWITSTQKIIEKQIDLAADAGIDFFNFCWYYNSEGRGIDNDPKNNALNLYLKSKNKNRVKFSLMIANHKGYIIQEKDWNDVVAYWVNLMKMDSYFKTRQGKPILTFFSFSNLLQTFNDSLKVRTAIDQLQNAARAGGLKNGVEIAFCDTGNPQSIEFAAASGATCMTGYNHHGFGFENSTNITEDISRMKAQELKLWNLKIKKPIVPLIPTVTLNWDDRPQTKKDKVFTGYSGQSVYNSIISCRQWVKENAAHINSDKIVFLYAWNEYVEGAWLTPSRSLGHSLLEGLKRGMDAKLK